MTKASSVSKDTPEADATRDAGYQRTLKWVKLGRYVEISGDSVDAVAARRKLGKWLDGRECKLVDGRLWINLEAVEKWVEDWPGQQ